MPCLRFIAVRIVPGRWILASTLSYCVGGICSNNTALRLSDDAPARFFGLAVGSVQARKPPTNNMWQNGGICQALFTEAFTSFAKRAMEQPCSKLLRRHCLLPLHVVEDCTVFYFLLLCPWLPSRLSARCFPSSWPDTASFRSCPLLPPVMP